MTTHNPPRINSKYAGKCDWPIPDPLILPFSITTTHGFRLTKNAIGVNDGESCPTWEAKGMVEHN